MPEQIISADLQHRAEQAAQAASPSPILRYFTYAHLPAHLQGISATMAEVARTLDAELPSGAEKSAGLRKLLEAKDCFVRAALDLPVPEDAPTQPVRPVTGVVAPRVDVVDTGDFGASRGQ